MTYVILCSQYVSVCDFHWLLGTQSIHGERSIDRSSLVAMTTRRHARWLTWVESLLVRLLTISTKIFVFCLFNCDILPLFLLASVMQIRKVVFQTGNLRFFGNSCLVSRIISFPMFVYVTGLTKCLTSGLTTGGCWNKLNSSFFNLGCHNYILLYIYNITTLQLLTTTHW